MQHHRHVAMTTHTPTVATTANLELGLRHEPMAVGDMKNVHVIGRRSFFFFYCSPRHLRMTADCSRFRFSSHPSTDVNEPYGNGGSGWTSGYLCTTLSGDIALETDLSGCLSNVERRLHPKVISCCCYLLFHLYLI